MNSRVFRVFCFFLLLIMDCAAWSINFNFRLDAHPSTSSSLLAAMGSLLCVRIKCVYEASRGYCFREEKKANRLKSERMWTLHNNRKCWNAVDLHGLKSISMNFFFQLCFVDTTQAASIVNFQSHTLNLDRTWRINFGLGSVWVSFEHESAQRSERESMEIPFESEWLLHAKFMSAERSKEQLTFCVQRKKRRGRWHLRAHIMLTFHPIYSRGELSEESHYNMIELEACREEREDDVDATTTFLAVRDHIISMK